MKQVRLYKADDYKPKKVNENKKPKLTKLRKSITPGTVLIVLAGRFKGRRVVFLKQLPSGLLLVTGPYKINGVPLRRMNQAYVIATSTKVDVTGANFASVDDSYFAKHKQKKQKSSDNMFFERSNELTEEDKKRINEKKAKQIEFDRPLIANIKKIDLLGKYLATRFSLRDNQKPHEMKF